MRTSWSRGEGHTQKDNGREHFCLAFAKHFKDFFHHLHSQLNHHLEVKVFFEENQTRQESKASGQSSTLVEAIKFCSHTSFAVSGILWHLWQKFLFFLCFAIGIWLLVSAFMVFQFVLLVILLVCFFRIHLMIIFIFFNKR